MGVRVPLLATLFFFKIQSSSIKKNRDSNASFGKAFRATLEAKKRFRGIDRFRPIGRNLLSCCSEAKAKCREAEFSRKENCVTGESLYSQRFSFLLWELLRIKKRKRILRTNRKFQQLFRQEIHIPLDCLPFSLCRF
ncbi:hypothetical protein EHQ83_01850 [Leptospira yasudae]|uniref:Uncharacterized protein n=1 Tax=Leptospira yasudae TaxID=2202201 RepID=A0A6N4R259_9LEPT|nr:hypothetical protein EHQ77_18765 [Leptospira yasudae]TGL83356.1 hypothetical protein EHQ72_02680 [Leptospira yasudae]TGL89496.1 hypothetical protein EHQ83_01850 [Leptospira yasudae]